MNASRERERVATKAVNMFQKMLRERQLPTEEAMLSIHPKMSANDRDALRLSLCKYFELPKGANEQRWEKKVEWVREFQVQAQQAMADPNQKREAKQTL